MVGKHLGSKDLEDAKGRDLEFRSMFQIWPFQTPVVVVAGAQCPLSLPAHSPSLAELQQLLCGFGCCRDILLGHQARNVTLDLGHS